MTKNKKEKLGVWILGNLIIYSLLAFQIADFHKDIQEPIQYLVINHAEAYYGVGEPQALPAKTEILSPAGQAENHTVEEGSSMEAGDAGGTLQNQRSDASVSIEELIREYFPENHELATAIFTHESQLLPDNESWIDRTADGHAFSIGIGQVNLTQHEIAGVKCREAFKGKNKHAIVINQELYEKCKELAKDPRLNLEKCREIYEERQNFSAWGSYTSGAYKEYL